MKYTNEVIINLPLNRVIELFDSQENLFKWQPELITFEHLSGEKGEVGAKSKMVYKMGKREVSMIETITLKDLPDRFAGTYEAKGVWNEVSNEFVSIDEGRSKWIAHSHFKFKGFMSIMAFFMPGAFKKQSQLYLDRFKAFAEKEG